MTETVFLQKEENMGAAHPDRFITEEEYFAFCEANEGRYEYYNGEIFAMAGAMPDHNGVAAAMLAELYNRLSGRGCRVYASDQRLYIVAAGLYTFPDISVFYETPQYSPGRKDSLINPALLVEVLSAATGNYDRTGKFHFYKEIPSLKEYVLAEYTVKQVEVYTRQADDSWTIRFYSAKDPDIHLESLGITIPIDKLYAMAILPVLDRNPGQ